MSWKEFPIQPSFLTHSENQILFRIQTCSNRKGIHHYKNRKGLTSSDQLKAKTI